MPDTAEAPVIDTAPPAEASAPEPFSRELHPLTEVPPALRDLMKRSLPVDEDVEPSEEQPDPDAPPAEEPPKKPADKPKPPVDPSLRLAPDLTPKKSEDAPLADDIEEIPESIVEQGKTPKAKTDLKKFRETYNTLALEVRQLREKIKAPATPAEDPALTALVEQLKQEKEELSQNLERKGLELHPKFQEQFAKPIAGMMGQAVEIVKEADGDTAALERALSMPHGKARTAVLDEILGEVQSPTLRDRLGRLVDAIDTKTRQRDAVLRDHKGALSKLQQQEKLQQHEQLVAQEKAMNNLLDGAQRNLESMGLEVLKKTGDPNFKWWDDQADEIVRDSRKALFDATPEEMAHLAFLGRACGPYRSMFQAERKARIAAEERLKAIESSEPTFDGRPKQTPAPGDDGEFAPDEDITKVALAKLRRGDYGR